VSGHGNPGDGDRIQVVKYVSPALMGFIFSAAWGEDDTWDVALRYAGEFSGIKIAAGIGYQQRTDGNADGGNGILGCASARTFTATGTHDLTRHDDTDCEGWAGSMSIMHVPTGLFITAAGGQETDSLRNTFHSVNGRAGGATGTDSFWYLQAGIERNWFGPGKTTLYGEYHNVDAGSQIGAVAATDVINPFRTSVTTGTAAYVQGADVTTWGLGVVQAIDAAAMDLFISYRTREADVTLRNATTGQLAKSNALEDLQILSIGGMIKF
jgi:hypothetical protein